MTGENLIRISVRKISLATAADSTLVNMMNAVHDMQHGKENYAQCDSQTRMS